MNKMMESGQRALFHFTGDTMDSKQSYQAAQGQDKKMDAKPVPQFIRPKNSKINTEGCEVKPLCLQPAGQNQLCLKQELSVQVHS